MAITKTTPVKKTTAPQAQEKPAAASTGKAASRTAVDRQIRIEEASMELFTRSEASPQEPVQVSPELRQHMIRDAAYFRAERRGFTEGDPSRDWLEAELEIDRMLGQDAAARK
jgi:hypothetical protein